MGAESIISMIPYLAAGVIAFIFLVLYVLVINPMLKKRKNSSLSSLGMMDVDGLKKKGVMTKEEYEMVRRTMMRRELEATERQMAEKRQREILAQGELDPVALMQLLTPEEIAQSRLRKAAPGVPASAAMATPVVPSVQASLQPSAQSMPGAQESAARVIARIGVQEPTPIAPLPVTSPLQPLFPSAPAAEEPPFITDPLALPTASPATAGPGRPPVVFPPQAVPASPPSMNMPRVVQARNEGEKHPDQKGELELLLEKGAITPEEFLRLKRFFVTKTE